MNILEVNNLKKVYTTKLGLQQIEALRGISFSIKKGEYVAVMGESGSGKTTLLNLIASLDKITSGEIILNGKNISSIQEKELAAFRRRNLGIVFQDFNLLNTFSLKDNICLPLVLDNVKYAELEKKIIPIAEMLGIKDILEKYPYEVSGGQQQRCAIARGIVTNPDLILADEPTGALDSHNSDELLKLLSKINNTGQTIFMVTHSVKAASKASRVLFIKDGMLYHQMYKMHLTDEDMYEKISDVLKIIATGGDING